MSSSQQGMQSAAARRAALSDPTKLLRGSGSKARWMHVEGASTLAQPEVGRLADAAIARHLLPLARTGRGSVVLHSKPAKKRSSRRPG